MNRRVSTYFVTGSICRTIEDLQVIEECCQVCQKLFVVVILEESDTGEEGSSINKLTANLR